MSRKYRRMPIHIVEYHNEALEYIYKAIGSKHLPLEGAALMHFDAHPDMIIPDIIAHDAFDKRKLFDSLSIENWITPALYAGHFDTVTWMKAHWAKQIADGTYNFVIGHHKDSLKIRVSFPDDYFLSECLYCDETELENVKRIDFCVKTCHDKIENVERTQFCEIFKNKSYILDIDLDFFSTKNPIKCMLGTECYKELKAVYEFKPPKSKEKNEIASNLKNRQNDLTMFKLILVAIEKNSFEKWIGNPVFSELLSVYQKAKGDLGDEIDASLLHEFGCTTDDPELPHHISSDSEIESLLYSMEMYLTSLKDHPVLVTISRSSVDDYCPADQVDKIQGNVVRCLEKCFGNIEVFRHYDDM